MRRFVLSWRRDCISNQSVNTDLFFSCLYMPVFLLVIFIYVCVQQMGEKKESKERDEGCDCNLPFYHCL